MLENLFVYGTLGPNRPNEHILKKIGGSWEEATVRGKLKEEGWGAKMGYPGIKLDENEDEINGFVFMSENLSYHWNMLDAFEGEGYKRVLAQVKINSGKIITAYLYVLK